MTIKDALDRAKRLRRERLEQEAQQEPRPESARIAPSPVRAPEPVRPAVSFPPLKPVEVSIEACNKNRILLSEGQLRDLPQADAAFRLLRSRVQLKLKRHDWSSVAVTSPGPNEGKTVTAINLAISIAREKQRSVYLLDLDMRNPSICNYLGLGEFRSLHEFLAGKAQPEDVLFQTSIPKLVVAGTREPITGASELLAGCRLDELMQHIRDRSPDALIVVDLPPVNVTDEALLVAPRIDVLLIVVAEGATRREDFARALGALSEHTVAGVIVNRSSDGHTTVYDRYSA